MCDCKEGSQSTPTAVIKRSRKRKIINASPSPISPHFNFGVPTTGTATAFASGSLKLAAPPLPFHSFLNAAWTCLNVLSAPFSCTRTTVEAIGGPIGAGIDATFGEAPDEDVDLVLELEDLVRLCE